MVDKSPEADVGPLRQQTVLARFGELALRSDDLDEILTEACRLAGEALGTDLAKVVALQDDGQTLFVRAGVGWKPGVVGVATILAHDDTSEGHALKTGEPMISPDISQETRFKYPPFLTDNGVRAVANVIIIGGKDKPPFGILQIDSRTPREFTENDTAFLRSYANLLAATVDRLRVIGEVRDEEARLRLALEAGALGSWDLDLATMSATRTARHDQIFGYPELRPSWTFDDLLNHVLPEDRENVSKSFEETRRGCAEWHIECRISRADDAEVRWIELRGMPEASRTLEPDGAPARMLGIVADITDRKIAEAEIVATNATLEVRVAERTEALAKSNDQLNAFAYTVSHDLRAPLRAMEGFARILLDDFADGLGETGTRYAGRIVAAAGRMERLIDDLLAYSRLQRFEPVLRVVNLTPLAEKARAAAISEYPDGTIEIERPLLPMLAEPVVLGQIVANLVENAARFARADRPPHVVIRTEKCADRVRLWVEDDGIGIAHEHQARIFEVFERLHGQEAYPGTGIGLAIVAKGVEGMCGSYGVESELGEGSRFWVELASTEDTAEQQELVTIVTRSA
ncbi:histidine kinase [Sphingomonas antarctica]|uniref:ATP-binding protein n=1 Tax=Sphingomonas antarctica TaxID=2040274 RepID=UPI0039ED944B